MHGKYIDPLIDFSFKKIFGSESNKDLLIDLLNQIFREKKQIIDLTINQNENQGDTDDIGGVTFDLTCTGQDGEIFLIEVQRSNQVRLKQRMLCYGSRIISDMVPKGERENWAYKIPEVYVIVLLDGFALVDSPPDSHLHDICLCYSETGKVFYEGYSYIFIEFCKFAKKENELETGLDYWLYALKHASSKDDIPDFFEKPVFRKFFKIAEYSKLTKEEKEMYDTYLKRKWDYANALEFAREDGKTKGIEEGIEKGIEKEKYQTIVKLIQKGMDDDFISDVTGTDINYISGIRKTYSDIIF